MKDIPTPADYVAVEFVGKAAGIPARTLRHWISTGKLAAIAGKREKPVSMGEVEQLARMIGKPVGNMASPAGNPATSAEEAAGNVANGLPDGALVSDLARRQLATIRDEWLAPLIERIGTLERENGRLEAEREQLRRRAEIAEAELLRRRIKLEAVQPAQDAPGSTETPTMAQDAAPGVWGRLRRWWGG